MCECSPGPLPLAQHGQPMMPPGTDIPMPLLAPAGSTSFFLLISLSMPLVAQIPPPGWMSMAVHLLGLGSLISNTIVPPSPSFSALTGALPQIVDFDGPGPYAGLLYHSLHTMLHKGELVPDRAAPVQGVQVPRSLAGWCAPYPAVRVR
jgi:hypothetical protein